MNDLKPGWQRVKFGELANCINDRVDDPSKAGVERYVGLEHLDPESLTIRRWGSPEDVESTKLRFTPGDIIFGKRRAYQRKLAVADFEGICSAHAMVLRAKPDLALPEFLPFFMQSDLFMERAVEISVGSLSPTINWKTLAKEEFALPPMEEQMRITQLLEAIRATVEYCQRSMNEADTVISAFVENRLDSLRSSFSEASAVDLLDRLTVGIVVKPSDWYTSDGSGVPALRSLNVRPGELNFNDLVRISSDGHAAHEKSQLLPGDVVVVRTGRPGEAAVVPEEIGLLNCIDLIVTTPGKNLNPHFFALFLNSATGRRSFSAGAAGTAQQHFNVGAFKRIRLPLPPIDIQVETVSKVEVFASARSALEDRIAGLKMLMQSALQDGVIQ